jgi:hypothetical protein
MTSIKPESRHFTRIAFAAKVHIVSAEGSWYSDLLDVSMKGALIGRPDKWSGNLGDHFLLELPLDDNESNIRMEVSVAHMEQSRVGFRCEHIDLDSISHLRRLVELNLGDETILRRELSELTGYT